jgi:transposase
MLAQLGINEEDWQQTLPAVRAALCFLWQQNQRLLNRCEFSALQIERLEAQLARLSALEAEVAELRERLGQNSGNSSKPPSSDPPSHRRPAKREPSGRLRGGQPGHTGSARQLLEPEQVNHTVELRPVSCQQCGGLLLGDDPQPERHQVSELPRAKAEVTEYRRHTLTCLACGAVNQATWPVEMPPGSFGPRVQATVGYLTGRLGLSQRDVKEALQALHGLELSLGSVPALQQQVSAALEHPVETARQFVARQATHAVDETGWREGQHQSWLWVNATEEVTIFKVLPGRGSAQAREVLGRGFSGTVNTDRYAAYDWVDAHRRQLCWAHLARDFQAFVERGGESEQTGRALLEQVSKMFEAWNEVRAGRLGRTEFQVLAEPIRQSVSELLQTGAQCGQAKTAGTCRKILQVETSLWTFAREEGVEPTNNLAERALRRAVLWRRKSFGTKSAAGSRFVERILTTVTSLRQQGRDVLDYLTAACASVRQSGGGSVCLLPEPP